jgi:hypothetical protein
MRRALLLALAFTVVASVGLAQYGKSPASSAAKPDFDITATYIESCSCDMFCPCYFNTQPTHHGSAGHYCRANLVMKVDKGHYKDVKLDGVKLWIANDLGGDFTKGKGEWFALIYDPSVTKPQQAAMRDIFFQLYALHQKSRDLGSDTAPIEWKIDTASGMAVARLGGKYKGETTLKRWGGDDPKKEVVINNLKYWGAQSNSGFRMWKAERNYFEGFGQKYDTRGTNGFLITIRFSGKAGKASTAD